MHFAAVFVALVGATVAAPQTPDLSGIPGCALVCALQEGKKAGCTSGDVQCFCTSADALAASQSCVESTCSEADAKKAIAGAQKLCAPYGGGAVEARSSPEAPPASSPAAGGTKGDKKEEHSKPQMEEKDSAKSTSCTEVYVSTSQTPAAASTPVAAVYTGAASFNHVGAVAAVGVMAFAAAL